MERLRELYQGQGYTLTAYPTDGYSFYYCLMAEMDREPLTNGKARKMQSELFEFQTKNSMYYHLFLSQCVTYDELLSSNDCLQLEFKKIINTKKHPTPREVFAAAEMLQRYICVIRFDRSVGRNIEKLQGYIFAPASKENLHMEPLCLLMLVKADGVVEFGRIGRKDNMKDLKSCPGQMVNTDHKHCFGLRFVNDFSVLFDRKVAYGEKSDVKDLFRRLSLEFYGTENHHRRILNIICNFELEEDNLELFCKYADNTITEETSLDDKRKRLKTHVKDVRSRTKPAGEGELFAVSSVYNVDVVIDVTGRDEWETYMSVVCCYLSCFDSPIILRVQGRDDKLYMPYVTNSNTCSCCQQKPQIQGHIGKVKCNIHEAVLKHPCCAPEIRKGNHTHLKHVPNIRSCWPPRKDYILPADFMTMVISRLEIEDRRIDQINGGEGSLAKAMAKELYGDENEYLVSGLQDAIGREDLDYDVKLRQLSNWLKVPIYIYMSQKKVDDGHAQFNASQRFLWTKFEPDLSMTIVSSDCRFYITLFYNHLNGTFDRIIPLRGCNCQNPAPLSLLRNSQNMETQFLSCVYPDDRHHPLPTFLTTDPDRNNFDMEIRDFPACSAYSSVRIAMQRNDMGKRTIDCVEINQHSLLRCLSKEIFGTEKNVDLLIEELCNEFSNNVESYIHFVGEKIIKAYEESGGKIQNNRSSNEKLAKFVKERIEDDLPCDELLLWLACTFFQTTIFVLRVTDTKTSTESFWTEYAMVRRRRKDPTRRTSFSRRCSKEKTYYITLFESGSKLYHRIVPKQASCNCALDAPTVPDHNADATEYHTFQDCKLMRKIRKIDSLLNTACILVDQWLICNQILQRNCELIVLEIEGRRKNVNIATIAGTGTGIVGAVLTGVGIFLAPATGGLSTLLSVGGAVMAVSGGTVATGAKITESVLNNSTIDKLKRYQNCYKERFDSLKSVIKEINNEMKELSELSKEIQANQNIESSDFADIQSIPGIVRAVKGLIMIPISLLKVSARGITILGAIIGPLSALIDAALLVFSAKNMAEGNKTDVTENLRRISAALYGSRRQMHSWAYGNQRPYHYD